jgi:hypothetical protein
MADVQTPEMDATLKPVEVEAWRFVSLSCILFNDAFSVTQTVGVHC